MKGYLDEGFEAGEGEVGVVIGVCGKHFELEDGAGSKGDLL